MAIKKIIGTLGLIALACRLSAPVNSTVVPSSSEAAENRIVQETAVSPQPPATASTPLNPEPTRKDPGRSASPPVQDPILTPDDFQSLPLTLLEYLNRGASVDGIEQAFDELAYINQGSPYLSGDLDGNQMSDLVVSTIDPSSQAALPDGALLIYLLKENGYELSLDLPYPGGPHLWLLSDLDADGRADLVFSQGACGAHSCFEEVKILSWDGGMFVERMEGSSAELPSPVVEAQDPDGDQVFQLEITGTDDGSVGAGPARTRTWIWDYDAAAWTWRKTEEVLGESKHRIHMLQDADDSAENGGFDQALLQYERVIGDSALLDWVDPSLEQANLGAYARYKMIVIYLIMGQADLAQIVYTDLSGSFPAGTSQHAFLQMADAFQQGLTDSDPATGCAEVEKYAAEHAGDVLDPLNAFGYANPVLTPRDLCPWNTDS